MDLEGWKTLGMTFVHIHWLHNSQCNSQTDLALVAPGTSMKLKHLQITSDGCETYANGFRRSKIPKIKNKFIQNRLS